MSYVIVPCSALVKKAARFLHNPSMVNLSAGDLGLEIDYGRSKLGDVLQRWDYENDGWRDFKRD